MFEPMDLIRILPEIILALLGLVLLLLDVFVLRKRQDSTRRNVLGYTILGTLVFISVLTFFLGPRSYFLRWFPDRFGPFLSELMSQSTALNGAFLYDGITLFFRVVFLLAGALVLLLSFERGWANHDGEYYHLLILSVLGMSLMAAAGELITMYVALELTSISLYLLAGFDFNRRSTEAGLKYFIFGGFSSALLLYGISLIYGFTGTTTLNGIAQRIGSLGLGQVLQSGAALPPESYGLFLGIAFLVAGFGFKLAVVPFHTWAPDVYEGAPTPIAALISTGSKAASFVVVVRIFWVALGAVGGTAEWGNWGGWKGLLALLAAVTFSAANLMALPQRNVKRLLAYSSIAHAGYMLIGVLLGTQGGLEALFYYIFAYVATNIGAFACVVIVSRSVGGEDLEHFAGLSKRSLPQAGALTILFFSLAGVPPLAGFFAKFWLFKATFDSGLIWLAAWGLFNTIIAFFYYLRVLKAVWFEQPAEEQPLVAEDSASVVLLATSILVIAIGVLPQLWLRLMEGAVQALF